MRELYANDFHNPGIGAARYGQLVLANVVSSSASVLSKVKVTNDPQKTRADYVARMQQQTPPPAADVTLGSLWTSNGA